MDKYIIMLNNLKETLENLDTNHYVSVLYIEPTSGNELYYNFSKRNTEGEYQRLLKYIEQINLTKNMTFFEEESYSLVAGSDIPYDLQFNFYIIDSFIVKKYQNRSGAYWAYEFKNENAIKEMFTEENWNLLINQLKPNKHCIINCIPEVESHFNKHNISDIFQLKNLKDIVTSLDIFVKVDVYTEANNRMQHHEVLINDRTATNKYNISLFDNHYFNNIIIKSKVKPANVINKYFRYRVIDWIRYFKHHNMVNTINIELIESETSFEKVQEIYNNNKLEEYTKSQIKVKDTNKYIINKVIAADTETMKNRFNQHIPYLLGWYDGNKFDLVKCKCPARLIKDTKSRLLKKEIQHLRTLNESLDKKSEKTHVNIIYFHNLKFDNAVLLGLWDIPGFEVKIIQSNNQIYEIQLIESKTRKPFIFIRDSYKLIPVALSKFKSMFKLQSGKQRLNIGEINTWKKYSDNIKEVDEYLKYDCMTLHEGLLKLKELCNNIKSIKNNVDPLNFLTISSYAFELVKLNNCLTDVYQYSGFVQEYIMKAMTGGRVQTKNNKKITFDRHGKKIIDLDVNSMYAKAMLLMNGLPKGNFKIFRKYLPKIYNMFILTCKILELTPRNFGVLSVKDENQKNIWITKSTPSELYLNKEIIMDNKTFYECLKYNKMKVEIIGGIYWDEGLNTDLSTLVDNLYEERMKHKKYNNPIQEVLKLILNSIYGKFIQKINKYKVKVNYIPSHIYNSDNIRKRTIIKAITTEDTTDEKILKGKWREPIRNPNIYITEYYDVKATFDYFNYAHCGVRVLSYSKSIVNDVLFRLPPSIIVVYTDTDSLFCIVDLNFDQKTLKCYHETELGKFSSDFKDDLYGVKAVFSDKKKYCIKFNNNENLMRCKGITSKALEKVCLEEYDNDCFDLYNSNKEISFNLNEVKFCPKFKNGGWGGCFETELIRKVTF